MKKILALLFAGVLMAFAGGCGSTAQADPVSKTNLMLDTVITLTLYDESDPAVLDLAFDEISRLEDLLSVTKEGSDLDRLYKAAGTAWVEIAPETQEVLLLAKEYAALSDGYFDVTAGPLIDLWGIHNGEGHYPSQAELDAVLPLISSDELLVENGKAYLARAGMKANLGAIAKGYIADRVKALMVENGVQHATLDLGRNVLLIGGKTADTEFRVGVADPNSQEGTMVGTISVSDKSIVTSGINERYFTYEGKAYHHILDPFTGFPADNGVASVTILSDSSAQGDALSTTCLLLGQERGLALIEGTEGVEALYIMTDGTMVPSSGFPTDALES
ncbi:MAG: FAD:protein FMN transferase [Ruminiclostridium sp.]|nr:FAD:protein FMN transferase [Ruminiclostridium sp.]